MSSIDLSSLTVKELLQLQASVIGELNSRNVIRTQNNPLGDYTEWLVAKAYWRDAKHGCAVLTTTPKNPTGFDAIKRDFVE